MFSIYKKDNLSGLIAIMVSNPEILARPEKVEQTITVNGDVVRLCLEMDGVLGELTLFKNGNAKWDPFIDIEVEITD